MTGNSKSADVWTSAVPANPLEWIYIHSHLNYKVCDILLHHAATLRQEITQRCAKRALLMPPLSPCLKLISKIKHITQYQCQ